MAEHERIPAAWYPDQRDPGQLRWWNGQEWTDEVRPLIAAVPPAEEPRPAPVETPLLQTRQSLNAVAQPAQGFGHASPEQLRSWGPPAVDQRSEIPAPVREVPREWVVSSPMAFPQPVPPSTAGEAPFLTRRQLRQLVGPLTTATE